MDKYKAILDSLIPSVRVYTANVQIINKMNILDSATDIVGIIKTNIGIDVNYTDISDCILLENVQDPGNLGAILRVAMASGIKNVGLIGNCVDVYNPKVLRASQGLQFGLHIYESINFAEFLRQYTGNIIATTPNTNKLLYDINLKLKTAFIFGNEGNGLSLNLLNQIAIKVKIPMLEGVDSLNIAMATTVCAFELVRQRMCG
jgi:TrmH family RNA methyltransferase